MKFKGYQVQDFNFEWNWLIILDACRYDFFVKVWNEDKQLQQLIPKPEPRISLGSCTLEFLRKLPHFYNTICITGHPFVLLFRDKFTYVKDVGFNYDLDTVPPNYIIDYVLKNWLHVHFYKRRVLWFLQPHFPFIGETKLNIRIHKSKEDKGLTDMKYQEEMFRKAYEDGILWKAYEDNLKLVLNELKRLLPKLKGVIVITSDHAEGLGKPYLPNEQPVFAHPCEREELELRLVPFIIIKKF